ncbi:hypothetical protein FACS1894200_04820 [Spirochaetia bacterium]|nr:hypothetical protein FACS1894200_04820 [Spirochaetia bacterium]
MFKKRIARIGEGKSSGYRVILFFKKDERLFFSYVFAKSNRANISRKELREYKEAVGLYLDGFTDKELDSLIEEGNIKELEQ